MPKLGSHVVGQLGICGNIVLQARSLKSRKLYLCMHQMEKNSLLKYIRVKVTVNFDTTNLLMITLSTNWTFGAVIIW